MKIIIRWILLVLIASGLIYGCTPRSRYERRLKQELASGIRYDSLFLGLYLGMSDKDFYTQCWSLNQKGIIKQSPNNQAVEYDHKDILKASATMQFYPEFEQGEIVEMPVRFSYKGWAPWNKELSSDNLQKDILEWFKKDYGDEFIAVKHPVHGIAYVKIDGNRRITIFKQDDFQVWAVFTDIMATGIRPDSASEAEIIDREIIKDLEK